MTNATNDISKIGHFLNTNILVKFCEILLVFIAAFAIIKLLLPIAGDNLIKKQAIVWFANVIMLIIVFSGLKMRGESLSHFGLRFNSISLKQGFRIFLMSLLVFVLAISAFIIGSIIMANITGIPESSDMSNYTYLQNNLPMLLLTLLGVYIVSSFGEEVIYRAFLITRITELGLDSKWGKAFAVLLSSIVFGLVHYEWGPMGIVQTGFMGLALGICFLKFKRNLWLLILAHAYMDTILMIQMYLA